jgi:hypothetical protein
MIRAGQLVAVDTVDSLRERAVRRVEIQFDDAVTTAEFSGVPNLADVTVESDSGLSVLRCHLTGSADALVKAAEPARISRLDFGCGRADIALHGRRSGRHHVHLGAARLLPRQHRPVG